MRRIAAGRSEKAIFGEESVCVSENWISYGPGERSSVEYDVREKKDVYS